MTADPLGRLVALPGVAQAAAAARDAVDRLLWDRRARSRMAELVAESRERGAWASAALDGAELPAAAVRDRSALDGSPMGRVLSAALAATAEVPALVDVSGRAPLQAWARVHAVAARGLVPDGQVGRPRSDGEPVDDPLHLPPAPSAAQVSARLDTLAALLTRPTTAPAVVVAGVVHGELLVLRPFAWGSGLVARAALRLVLAARGVDPDGAGVPEEGLRALGRPAYVAAARAYLSAEPEGVARWLVHTADAIRAGAEAVGVED